MNWLDIVILGVLVLGILWGLKTGLIGAAIYAIGALIGFFVAGQIGDDVGGWFGDSLGIDTTVTVIVYAVIIIVALVITGIVEKLLKPALIVISIASMGLNKMGGLLLGLVMGLVVASAVIVAMARFAYNFEPPDPDLSAIEQTTGVSVSVPEIPVVDEAKDDVVNALTASTIVPIFMDIRDILPGSTLGFIPSDFNVALDILAEDIDIE